MIISRYKCRNVHDRSEDQYRLHHRLAVSVVKTLYVASNCRAVRCEVCESRGTYRRLRSGSRLTKDDADTECPECFKLAITPWKAVRCGTTGYPPCREGDKVLYSANDKPLLSNVRQMRVTYTPFSHPANDILHQDGAKRKAITRSTKLPTHPKQIRQTVPRLSKQTRTIHPQPRQSLRHRQRHIASQAE